SHGLFAIPGLHSQTVGWATGSAGPEAAGAGGAGAADEDDPPPEPLEQLAANSATRANRTTITAARGRGTTHIVPAGKERDVTRSQIIAGIAIFGSVMLLMLGIMLWGVFTENRNR
ncbi:MAG: hypothetical protein QOJ32_2575, partial [Frankiaceae bacterium]|nr:hypothetical protein [Frankiaceae bacterium]